MKSPNPTMPLGPLEKIAKLMADLPNGRGRSEDPDSRFNEEKFAQMVGVSPRAIARWRANDCQIPWTSADTAAVALGLHPLLVWPEEWSALDIEVVEGTHKDMGAIERAMGRISRKMGLEPVGIS